MARIFDKTRPQTPLTSNPERDEERPPQRPSATANRLQNLRADLQTLEKQAERPATERRVAPATERGAPEPYVAPQRKMNQAEAERFFSQAGFSRLQRKRGRGVELDNVTEGPIPLPLDEVDEAAWDQGGLDDAQEHMMVAGGQLGALKTQLAASPDAQGELSTLEGLVALCFTPSEADLARLEGLAAAEGPEVSLDAARGTVQQHFGVDLAPVASGPALLACALVVGGLSQAVVPKEAGLDSQAFVGGMQQLVDRSQSAVGQAQTMSSGISRQRAVQRTIIKKR